jgi:hypothetical protein
MSWARWEALTGVVAVILWVVGTLISEGANERPEDETPQEFLAYFQEDPNTLIGGEFVLVLGVVFFVWFLGILRGALRTAEGGDGRLAAVAFGSGLLAGLGLLLAAAPTVQGAISEEDLSPEGAQTLVFLSDSFFGVTEFMLVPMFVAVGLLSLRTKVFPVWLGWVSLALALLLLIIPIGWAGVVFGFPLWTLVVSVLLYLRRPAPAGPSPAV